MLKYTKYYYYNKPRSIRSNILTIAERQNIIEKATKNFLINVRKLCNDVVSISEGKVCHQAIKNILQLKRAAKKKLFYQKLYIKRNINNTNSIM